MTERSTKTAALKCLNAALRTPAQNQVKGGKELLLLELNKLSTWELTHACNVLSDRIDGGKFASVSFSSLSSPDL